MKIEELYAEVHNYLNNKGIGSNYGTNDVIDTTIEVLTDYGYLDEHEFSSKINDMEE